MNYAWTLVCFQEIALQKNCFHMPQLHVFFRYVTSPQGKKKINIRKEKHCFLKIKISSIHILKFWLGLTLNKIREFLTSCIHLKTGSNMKKEVGMGKEESKTEGNVLYSIPLHALILKTL